jgi:hypothetical protein
MAFNLSKLATLAASVEKAGAPILGAALRAGSAISGAAPFPLSLVLPSILGSLADAVGGTADDAASIVAKIDGSPDAAAKIQAVEESHKDDLTNTLDMLKLQTDQNEAELNVNAPLWARLLYSGWRPLMGWISGPVLMAYQIGAVTFGGRPVPMETFAPAMALWTALAGLRTSEKWQGVAAPLPMAAKCRTR